MELPSFNDACAFIRSLNKPSVSDQLRSARSDGRVIVQPRCGVGDHRDMLALLTRLQDEAQPDILTLTIDSYSRLRMFEKADALLRSNPQALNGYPLVAQGWRMGRDLNLRTRLPLDIRHGSPLSDELFEMAIASGITSFEGGGISYNLPYAKNVPLEASLASWRRIDRRCGELAEEGIIVAREMFGTLTAVLVPPSLSIAVTLLEAISAAQQGARCIEIAYPQGGNVVQDVAALRSTRRLAQRYLPEEVEVYSVLHQYMGPFPKDPVKARALIVLGGLVAKLGGAEKIVTKTHEEAYGIPTACANVEGILLTKYALSSLFSFIQVDRSLVEEEMCWIEREVAELIEPLLGGGNLDRTIAAAFKEGKLDLPFSPSINTRNAVIPMRDGLGAIRYLTAGLLPFSEESKSRNDQSIAFSKAAKDQAEKIVEDVGYFTEGSGIYAQGRDDRIEMMHDAGVAQQVQPPNG